MNNRYLNYALLGAVIVLASTTSLHAVGQDMVVFKNLKTMFNGATDMAESAKPVITTAIALVSGISIGIYQRSFWQAIIVAVLSGAMVYFFPSLFS